MPPPPYAQGFGLSDNPFSPGKPYPGVKNNLAISMIVTAPLKLDEEERLFDLYACDAGLFDKHFQDFRALIEAQNYIDNPPEAGFNPFLFLIHGPVGTGKTTFANVMVAWLRKCMTPGRTWVSRRLQFSPSSPSSKQCDDLDRLETDIVKNTDAGGHCYAVIDNLVDGADEKAFEMYLRVNQHSTFFMFATTSNAALRQKTWDNSPYPVNPYETTVLSEDNAVAFVRRRVEAFRVKALAPHFAANELFPFREANIRKAVKDLSFTQAGAGGIITLRQFGQAMNNIIVHEAQGVPPGFDVSKLPQQQLVDHEIDVIAASSEIIRKKMVA